MISYSSKTLNDIYYEYLNAVSPEKTVLCLNESAYTLDELQKNIELYTKHLIKLGVRTGTCVGYTMPNSVEIFYLFFAISRLGACAVPQFHMLPDMAKVGIYKKCNVKLVLTKSQQYASLKEASDKMEAQYEIATVDADDNAFYNFTMPLDGEINSDDYVLKITDPELPLLIASTSGTTGTSKFVSITQSNYAAEVRVCSGLVTPFNINGTDGYSMIMAFPISTSGIQTCLGTMLSGVCTIYTSEISPVKFMQLLTHWKADSMAAPPAFYEALLSLPTLDSFDLTSIKRVTTGMDFFSPSLYKRLKSKFTGIEGFANGYGLVETCNVYMICKSFEKEPASTTLMELFEGVGNSIEVRDADGNCVPVGSEGELFIKGANVVKGYINNPEETEKSFKDGWFKTGDIVRNEGGNCVTLLGRRKYLIKRGGKSVSPIVVQDHINKLPCVKASAVVGVPHPLYGEMVWAFIVAKEGQKLELKDIMKHCRSELANYMVPDQVSFIDDIPKNGGVGKVNYEKLKEIANNELSSINGGSHE